MFDENPIKNPTLDSIDLCGSQESLVTALCEILEAGRSQREKKVLERAEQIELPAWWNRNRNKIKNNDLYRAELCRQFSLTNTEFLEEKMIPAKMQSIGTHITGDYHCFTLTYSLDGPIIIDSTWKQFCNKNEINAPDTFCGTPEDLVQTLLSKGVTAENIHDNYGDIVVPVLVRRSTQLSVKNEIK